MSRSILNVLAICLVVTFTNAVVTPAAWAQKKTGCKAGTTKIPGDGTRCKCVDGEWSCKKVR